MKNVMFGAVVSFSTYFCVVTLLSMVAMPTQFIIKSLKGNSHLIVKDLLLNKI